MSDERKLQAELEKCIEHTLKQDPEKLRFAVMATGYTEAATDSTLTNSVIGGSPQDVSTVCAGLMKMLMEVDMSYTLFFLHMTLQQLRKDVEGHNTGNTEDLGGPKIKAQVEELITKLQKGVP